VNPTPTIGISSTGTAVCAGQSVTFLASGAFSYTWNTGATGNSISSTPTINSTYTVNGTSSAGCTSSKTVAVVVNALPNVNASTSAPVICTGQSATLTASGASTYTWSDGSNGTSVAITPTANVTYTVNATDANGCQNNAVITQSVSTCTGVNAAAQSASSNELFAVYPNPSKGDFTVVLNETSEVIVYNVLAEVIITKTAEAGQHRFNINNKAAGVYFVKAISGSKQHVIKLVIE
jgi:hypothetical protein